MLIRMCKEYEHVIGCVGWVDLKDENLAEVLKKWEGERYLFGFREIL